jgi:hypothetical protein
MTPQEKADELFRKMYEVRSVAASDITKHFAKQSALITVDEILSSFSNIFDDFVVESSKVGGYRRMKKYWEEVKQEIEKI